MNIQPGDVLATRSTGRWVKFIRFGAAVRELVTSDPEPNLDNHIAVVHHQDVHGTWWCLEGRPGGVGWRDATAYLRSPWTVSNAAQPKTTLARQTVCGTMLALVGTQYDWEAIAADAGGAFGLDRVWRPTWHGQVPGHVVCSSAAAYAYTKAGLPRPDEGSDGREVSPADWLAFMISNRWEVMA